MSFDKNKIIDFLSQKGIALYDTATVVRRLQDNASDKFLEIVSPTDIKGLLERIPECRTIVTTGEKATDTLCGIFGCRKPKTGESVRFSTPEGREMTFYRMPSSSRAYPMSVDRKAEIYKAMFTASGIL